MSVSPLPQNYCPNFSSWLIGTHNTDLRALIYRARCGQWDCDYCCNRNQAIWRARIIRSIDSKGGEWFMVTITANRKMRGQVKSLANLRNGWSKYICEWFDHIDRKWKWSRGLHGVLMDSQNGVKFEYVRVYEPHKDGTLHAHLLTNYHPRDYIHPYDYSDPREKESFAPGSRLLKDAAAHCGLGFQVKIEMICGHAGLAASYVTKYITKNLANLPKGTRRIETSKGFLVDDDSRASDYDWRMSQTLTKRHLEPLWDEGYLIRDPAIEHIVKPSDFENQWVYLPYKMLMTGEKE